MLTNCLGCCPLCKKNPRPKSWLQSDLRSGERLKELRLKFILRVSGPHDCSCNPTHGSDSVPSWASHYGREVILRSGQLRKLEIPHHLFIYY